MSKQSTLRLNYKTCLSWFDYINPGAPLGITVNSIEKLVEAYIEIRELQDVKDLLNFVYWCAEFVSMKISSPNNILLTADIYGVPLDLENGAKVASIRELKDALLKLRMIHEKVSARVDFLQFVDDSDKKQKEFLIVHILRLKKEEDYLANYIDSERK